MAPFSNATWPHFRAPLTVQEEGKLTFWDEDSRLNPIVCRLAHCAKLDAAWAEVQALKLQIKTRLTLELEINAVACIDAFRLLRGDALLH
jgi:hypothetical protein